MRPMHPMHPMIFCLLSAKFVQSKSLVMRSIVLCAIALCTFAPSLSPAQEPATAIRFTAQEEAYLRSAKPITMCADPDWVPFERITPQGEHQGIAADLVQLVAQRVGLQIVVYPAKTWDESLAASKSGRCQLMSFLNQTPARDQWLNFTQPIFSDQNIIVTREEHPYIGDLQALTDHRVVVPRNTMVEERIRRDFPHLTVITTISEDEAMAFVSERKADLTVRSLIVAAYAIKKEGLFNLKISGQIPAYTNQLRIGVIKSEPILRDILDKGVSTITAQEREAITNKHVSISVQKGIDYVLVWQIIIGGGLIMVLVLLWNRKLTSLNKALERLSVTDTLTGVFNRLKIDAVLEQEIVRANRFGQPFSVIMLDIDHFKSVNDTYGHQAGDQVLIAIATILRENTRETDIVGRWGGEEFIVICPQTERSGAVNLADGLRQKIERHTFAIAERKSASFGVATYQTGDLAAALVKRADSALYQAKDTGRNRVEVG